MRLLIILAGLNVAIGLSAAGSPVAASAAAAECSGQNCPPPSGQGHDCERKRKDATTS